MSRFVDSNLPDNSVIKLTKNLSSIASCTRLALDLKARKSQMGMRGYANLAKSHYCLWATPISTKFKNLPKTFTTDLAVKFYRI